MARRQTKPAVSKLVKLRREYDERLPDAQRLSQCMIDQLDPLIVGADVSLGVPVESRVKTWQSIEEKIGRKSLNIFDLSKIEDFVGVRTIVLFQNDVVKMDEVIKSNFDIISRENTSDRLEDSEFGYQSWHYIVSLKPEWAAIPTYAGLGGFKAEIQVRTLAQHIWAAASHKLQYKQEQSVPPPLRRSINRVSALLETVDLEFSRVLHERDDYNSIEKPNDTRLNVEILKQIIQEKMPKDNYSNHEQYDKLLSNLFYFGVETSEQLSTIIDKRLAAAIKEDQIRVGEFRSGVDIPDWADESRIKRGVFYTYTGLTREVLRKEFGDAKVNSVLLAREDPNENG